MEEKKSEKVIVEANEFVLKDSQGRVRGTFGFNDKTNEPMLNLLDENGKTRLMASLKENGSPAIALLKADGDVGAVLNSDESGSCLFLVAPNQCWCAVFTEETGSGILVTDENQRLRSALTFKQGRAGLTLDNDETPSSEEKSEIPQSEVSK